MDKSWKIDPWKIHGKSNAKTMGKTMENSMGKSMENPWGNPWKIKTEKKEIFPWFSMDNKMPTSFWAQNHQKWTQKLGSDLTPNGIIID